MTKRLVRAKAKIKATGLRFEEPEARALPQRVATVLEAIYGAHTLDWNHDTPAPAGDGLAGEALHLTQVVAALMPAEAEALGLLALLELEASRVAARVDARGLLVPLHLQHTAAWNGDLLDTASQRLDRAATLQRPGPFQIEAAIQLAHASRRRSGTTPWADIRVLYAVLLERHPSVGAQIGHAMAAAHARNDTTVGLALLQEVDPTRRASHQGWWAARAHLLERAGMRDQALAAYERALELSRSPQLQSTLAARQRLVSGQPH